MSSEIVQVGGEQIEPATVLRQRVAAVHSAYKSVMKDGVHYGIIPGTGKKPSLLKPGAEMLCTQFRLVPSYEVERTDLPGGHREYGVTCTLTKLDTGQIWAQGIGLCTTMESKYRYRWHGYGSGRKRTENPDIADTYNTVLKMAKKRALVDATLTATGCSDMFTQDVEDFQQPETVEAVPEVDLSDTRAAFAEYKHATGADNADAMRDVCAAVGATDMHSMTQEQADKAAEWLRAKSVAPAPEPTAPEPEPVEAVPVDAEPEPEQADYATDDINF